MHASSKPVRSGWRSSARTSPRCCRARRADLVVPVAIPGRLDGPNFYSFRTSGRQRLTAARLSHTGESQPLAASVSLPWPLLDERALPRRFRPSGFSSRLVNAIEESNRIFRRNTGLPEHAAQDGPASPPAHRRSERLLLALTPEHARLLLQPSLSFRSQVSTAPSPWLASGAIDAFN
jgi:hypothetical protein